MLKRFKSAVKKPGLNEADMSEAYFAYLMAIKISEQVIRDDPEDGLPLINSILNTSTKYFMDLVEEHEDSDFGMQVKIIELRNFIFQHIIEELIVILAKNGGVKDIIPVAIYKAAFRR